MSEKAQYIRNMAVIVSGLLASGHYTIPAEEGEKPKIRSYPRGDEENPYCVVTAADHILLEIQIEADEQHT